MNKLKKWTLGILLGLFAITPVLTLSNGVEASATEADSYTEDFFEDWVLPLYEVEKSDEGTAVTVTGGALQVVNVRNATTVSIPYKQKDFVMQFEYTLLSETLLTGNDLTSEEKKFHTIDPVIGIGYREEGKADGYLIKMHALQKTMTGIAGNWGTQSYGSSNTTINGEGLSDERTGHGMENWDLNSLTQESDDKLLQFNYYRTRFYVGETYTFRLQCSGNLVELYVNDELYMKDILDEQTEGEGISLYFAGACTATVDNLSVCTPSARIAELVVGLPDVQAGQNSQTVAGYEQALGHVREYVLKHYSMEAFTTHPSYATYQEKVTALENLYQIQAQKLPVLTVAWTDKAYETETEFAFPKAVAKDYTGKELFVNVKAYFDGKRLQENEGKVSLNEAGEYTIVYSVCDSEGNQTSETKTFVVTQKSVAPVEVPPTVQTKEKRKDGLLIGAAVALGVVVLANVVIFIIRRKNR